MNKDDLIARILLANDHISRQPIGNITNLFHHLWAASFLLSVSKHFGQKQLIKISEDYIESVQQIVYDHNAEKIIVFNGKTLPIWNAFLTHCLFKLGRPEALQYCDSIKVLETRKEHNGIIIAVALEAYYHTQDPKYLSMARTSGDITLLSGKLSAFDAWGLAVLAKQVEEYYDKSKNYIDRMIAMTNISAKHMVGVVGPTAIQVRSARHYLTGESPIGMAEILESQIEKQIIFTADDHLCGAFAKSIGDMVTRLDYTISSAFALLQLVFPIDLGIIF